MHAVQAVIHVFEILYVLLVFLSLNVLLFWCMLV